MEILMEIYMTSGYSVLKQISCSVCLCCQNGSVFFGNSAIIENSKKYLVYILLYVFKKRILSVFLVLCNLSRSNGSKHLIIQTTVI